MTLQPVTPSPFMYSRDCDVSPPTAPPPLVCKPGRTDRSHFGGRPSSTRRGCPARDSLSGTAPAVLAISVPSSGPGKDIAPDASAGKVYRPNPKRSSANALRQPGGTVQGDRVLGRDGYGGRPTVAHGDGRAGAGTLTDTSVD